MEEQVLEHLEYLRPSFAESAPVTVDDVEKHYSSELAFEVRTEPDRQRRHGDGLALDLDKREVGHLGRDSVGNEASCS